MPRAILVPHEQVAWSGVLAPPERRTCGDIASHPAAKIATKPPLAALNILPLAVASADEDDRQSTR